MSEKLKATIARLGDEIVRKAFLNLQKQIAKELKRIEEEKKRKVGEFNKENLE